MQKKYKQAILGGTFDHFHAGHKHFIDTACKNSQKITIGLSLPVLFKNKLLASLIQNYETREKNIKNYLRIKGHKANIIPLNDIYGNSLAEKDIDAIFITKTGLKNAELINKERKKINFPHLAINQVSFLKGNDGKIISSQRIRAGEINRNGVAYIKIFTGKKRLIMPNSLKPKLREPFGKVIKNINRYKKLKNKKFIISVGDITTASLIKAGYTPNLSIVDFKSKRQKIDKDVLRLIPKPQLKCQNESGGINEKAVLIYKKALDRSLVMGKNQTIAVSGEEDLLALPAILLAPLESIVLYGLPKTGIAAVDITEKRKSSIESLLNQFVPASKTSS